MGIFKIFVIILLVLHLLFTIIVARQTKLMNQVVEAGISPAILLLSVIHVLFSLFVLLWAILFL
jgi:hypothetical protein